MIGWRSKQGVRPQAQPLSTRAPLHRRDEWPPELDEDASLRIGVAKLDPAARRQLREVLTWPESRRGDLLYTLLGRAGTEPLCQLIAIVDTDKVARLRLLRAIRDVS